MDELLFNDEGVVTVALLGFLRREGMARKVMTVGIIPIEDCCWQRSSLRVPALCLSFSISEVKSSGASSILNPWGMDVASSVASLPSALGHGSEPWTRSASQAWPDLRPTVAATLAPLCGSDRARRVTSSEEADAPSVGKSTGRRGREPFPPESWARADWQSAAGYHAAPQSGAAAAKSGGLRGRRRPRACPTKTYCSKRRHALPT